MNELTYRLRELLQLILKAPSINFTDLISFVPPSEISKTRLLNEIKSSISYCLSNSLFHYSDIFDPPAIFDVPDRAGLTRSYFKLLIGGFVKFSTK
ncbi:hypothetical protein BpHYR1_021907 [Brachionus plicatilis]|uniref:Uncharacterized protein n=1 Tax=Brachionus plicatilis TaxID=10195 RepID=A0A3M7PRW7_BRAPC|nr:hypothetical protein BpHYR1_021907 [Brachionus plicatilis]